MPSSGRVAEKFVSTWAYLMLISVISLGLLTAALAQPGESKEGGGEGAPSAPMGPGVEKGGPSAQGGPPQAPIGPPPAMVRLGEVKMEKLQQVWEVVGRLSEVRRSIVASEVVGQVIERPVDEGDQVVGGQTVLVRIDPVWAKLNLETSEAELARAKAMVAEARANLDKSSRERKRLEELVASRSTSQKELDDARAVELADQAKSLSAEAQVHAAQVALQRSQTEMKRLEVVAPFDGVVVKKMIEVGQWANQGTPLFEIVSRGKIDALIDVPERFVDFVQTGAKVDMVIEPLRLEVSGVVRAVVPDASNAARTFPVRVRTDDMDGRLKPGMSVLARVPTMREADTITVPRDAVLRSAQGATLWMNAGGMALPAPVEVLFNHGDRLAVRSLPSHIGPPLLPGVLVVIEGAESLFPTRPLIPIP